MAWEEIIGQKKAKFFLTEQLKHAKVSHAYLFVGADGVGKRTTAMIFARALNCQAEGQRPCDQCVSCRKILHQNNPDVVYFQPNSQKIKIEHIKALCQGLNYKTENTAAQVLIIDGGDKMTPDAANNLLKTLEEPPQRTHFIILAEEIAAVLPTILSRCQIVRFVPLDSEEIATYLETKHQYAVEKSQSVASLAQGSLGNALRMAEDENFKIFRSKALEILKFNPRDTFDILKFSSELDKDKNKENIVSILELVRFLIRDLMVAKVGSKELTINKDALVSDQDEIEPLKEIIRQYQLVDQAIQRLKANANRHLVLDKLLLGLKLDGRKFA